MNKKLVALAVSAIAAGAASAQTANVTLYGVVDTYVANIRASGGGKSVTQMDAGGLSGSRWGLRGSEALGGGLNAVFTLENGFDSSSAGLGQGGRLFGRQAYVGVTGGFGSLTVGRQYAPIFYTGADADVDGYSNFSVVTNHFLLRAAGALRVDNTVNYKTPNMGGITANVQWGFGEAVGSTGAGRVFGANLAYNNGPVNAGIGLVDVKCGGAASGAVGAVACPAGTAAGSTAQRTWLAGGSYNLGVANIGASYHELKNYVSAVKEKGWQVGANVPFGVFSVTAQIGQLKGLDGKNTIFNIGGNYSLSKRTDVYARYVNGNNNAYAAIDLAAVGGAVGTGASGALVAGQDKSAFGVGLRHRF
jgi:predicted porin